MYILFVITVSLLGIYHKVICIHPCTKMYEETEWCLGGREKGVWGGRQTIVGLLKFIFSLKKKDKEEIHLFLYYFLC